MKAPPGDAGVASNGFLAFLSKRGFDTEGDQRTKTRSALRYFTTGQGIA